MFREFEVTFTAESARYVKEQYRNASCILEYGSGGSTIYAATEGVTVITTESSSHWLLELIGASKEKNLPGDIIPLHADIGVTKEWGYPADESKWRSWPSYSQKAWQYCSDNSITPDLVLIDGRYRVACFIASCVNTTAPMRILFDDFAGRPYYHIVMNIVKPTEIVDNRLAVFDVVPGLIGTKYLFDNLRYFYDPA